MFSDRANEQDELIAKILKGQDKQRNLKRLNANFDRWLRREWNGNEVLAMGCCVAALAPAFGSLRGEWGTLTEQEQGNLLWYFSLAFLPTQSSADQDAAALRDYIRDQGRTLREFSDGIRTVRGK
jgi:hypothetical protein